jgi:hypothetical protein
MNDKLERMCEEAVVAYFKVPFWHLLRGTEKNHENLGQDSCALVKIHAEHLQNTSLKHYHLSDPARF